MSNKGDKHKALFVVKDGVTIEEFRNKMDALQQRIENSDYVEIFGVYPEGKGIEVLIERGE